MIPGGKCFPGWEAIGNLRRDPNFIWRDPMWDPPNYRGGIPSRVGGILGLIPPGMCFPRWETIGNLRRDPNFIWWDPTWDVQ